MRVRIVVSARRKVSTWARKLGEGGRVYLGNLLEGFPAESGGCERLAGLLDGGVGIDRPRGLGEPANELNSVEPAGESLAD